MKTLRAFWHWVDNDKPARITRDKLSKVALSALLHAEAEVAARAFGDGSTWSVMPIWDLCSSSDGTDPNARPEFFRPELVNAVRDLSLAICPALEAMHAAVPEAKPKPIELDNTFMTKQRLGFTGRDYAYSLLAIDEMKEWLPAAMPTDTFRGVDRSRDEEWRLSGVRVPQSFNLREPRVECFHCDQSFPESQIDAHGKECRQRTLEKFHQMTTAPSPMLTPVDQQLRMRNEVQQRDEYSMRAANYLASVVPPGTAPLPQMAAQRAMQLENERQLASPEYKRTRLF